MAAMEHSQGSFITSDGVTLFRQGWVPERPRAAVCLVHGAFEHSGRFIDVCRFLAEKGYGVYAFDLRGHGRSGGEIGPDTSFLPIIRDIGEFLQALRPETKGLPLFMLGQSLGGALTIMHAANPDAARILAGVVLCAPACKPVFPAPAIVAAYALGKLFPNLHMKALEARLISRDPLVAEAYESDPLVNRQDIPVRPLSEFMRLMGSYQRKFEQRDIPLLIFHGACDKVTDIRGSRELYRRSRSRDKRLRELPRFYHDLLNDPERAIVFSEIADWIEAHLQAKISL